MNYTKYDTRTGEIKEILFASSVADVVNNLATNEAFVPGAFAGGSYFIDLPSTTAVLLPTKPPGAYVFDYALRVWVPNASVQWAAVRAQRASALAASDWTQLSDVPMSVERRQQWEAYRQALRDITDQPDPFNIIWPTPPE